VSGTKGIIGDDVGKQTADEQPNKVSPHAPAVLPAKIRVDQQLETRKSSLPLAIIPDN
jgi:hypothetical protein